MSPSLRTLSAFKSFQALKAMWLLALWTLTAACDDEALSLLQRAASRGRKLPLTYASHRLLLDVSIGDLEPRRLLLDTGSSTVAFCNLSFPELTFNTGLKACEQYGPSLADGHFSDGYVGPFYRGSLRLDGLVIPEASYAVFSEGSCAPWLCRGKPSQGIFGVAFRQRNKAYPSSVNLSSACSDVPGDIEMLCPSTSASLLPPLLQDLRMTSEGSEVFGIYWSGKQEGALYLGSQALETCHYDPLAPRAVLAKSAGSNGWYNVKVMKIVVDGMVFQGFDCTRHARACIIDTGTPGILLPSSLAGLSFSQLGKLEFYLEAVEGSLVLDFDLSELENVQALGAPKAFWDPLMVIGLPLWAHYYTVFDLTKDTVSFTHH